MFKQKIYSKKEALNIFVKSAKLYHINLENRDILILFKNNKKTEHYEIRFLNTNFLHFTGVTTNLFPLEFYKAALNNRLNTNNFDYKNDELTSMKIDILENAVSFPATSKMIGIYNGPKIQLQADIGSGNVHFVMTFRFDGYEENNYLYPVGIQKEDVRNVTQPTSPIFAILRKNKNDKLFYEITYISKNINKNKIFLPKEYDKIIAPDALQRLKAKDS